MNKSNCKINKNGFMLLETLIVSTVILGTLVFLYVQFVNIKANYEISFKYNTIPGLFMTKEISNIVKDDISSLQTKLEKETSKYLNITSSEYITVNKELYNNTVSAMNIDTILFVDDNLDEFKNHLLSDTYDTATFDDQFKKYILRLNTNKENKYRIIIKFKDKTYASVLVGGNN